MKFMVSMISDGSYMEQATPEQRKQIGTEMMRFMGELREAGALVDPGAYLGPIADARTLRYGSEGEAVVTDGPFAETKEHVAGYMILECDDLDQAVEWLRRMPVRGASVELRTIREG
jgi:hypothetical protein